MEIFTLLENLEELLESGAKVPFSSKVMVDAEELKEILEDIRQALAPKEEIIENANKVSKEISVGTRDYADAILEKVEEVLKETLDVVHNNRKELK